MSKVSEKPKRLQPLPEILRRLFLSSGNLCAFPGCKELMIDLDGNFVGQICHIEAAESGGERFNALMTNEERRAFENLMLMCYPHHTITDNVKNYPVNKLKLMKAKHESSFADPVVAMTRVLEDETAKTEMQESQSLARMNDVLAWEQLSVEQLQETAKIVNRLGARLKNLPKNARTLVRIIVERAGSVPTQEERAELPFAELIHSCSFDAAEIAALVQILERHHFANVWEGEGPSQIVGLAEDRKYPGIWIDLLKFSRKSGISLKSIIDDVQFHLLD